MYSHSAVRVKFEMNRELNITALFNDHNDLLEMKRLVLLEKYLFSLLFKNDTKYQCEGILGSIISIHI